MILNWLGNMILGKREKQAIVINLNHNTVSGMETLMERYNEWQHQLDTITMDDIAEVAIQNLLRRALRVDWEEHTIDHVIDKPPVTVLQTDFRIRKNENRLNAEVVRGIRQG